MSAEENKAKVRLIIQLEDQGKMEDVVRFFSDDIVFHEPGGVRLRGRDELRERIDMIHSAFPDIRHTIEDLIAADDKVVARFSITGCFLHQMLLAHPYLLLAKVLTPDLAQIKVPMTNSPVIYWDIKL